MLDPLLTPFGEQQCRTLSKNFPYHESADLLVASPLRRTIHTALLSFPQVTKRGLEVIGLPEAQETTAVPCDTGNNLAVLAEEFKDQPVDLSLVKDGWNSKTGKWEPSDEAISARAKQVRQWLKARPEKEIILVTHGGFLHYFSEDWHDFNTAAGTGWKNTEYRTYRFKEESGDNASVVETEESRESRRGHEIALTETERLALARTRSRESNKSEKSNKSNKSHKSRTSNGSIAIPSKV